MSRPTKTPDVNPAATFSPEALAALLNEVSASRKVMEMQMAEIAELKAKADAAEAQPKMAIAGKTAKTIKNELECIRAFKKLGIKATPHVDTFTYNIWVSKGYRAKEGAKAVKVANLRLFHESQVRPLTPADKKAIKDQKAAHEARQAKGNVTPIGAAH